MNKFFLLLSRGFILGSFFLLNVNCSSNDKIIETKIIDGLTIVKSEDLKTNNVILEFFDKNNKKVSKHFYGNGFTICDTNMFYQNKINEYPNEIESFNEQDSLVAKIECLKIGDGIQGKNGKKFIYDCNRTEYHLECRIKAGFDYGPGYTKKAIKYISHFKINQDCNGPRRTFISESEYDYDEMRMKKKTYNQNGVIESVSYYIYPQEKIYEKVLYIDGEYIKTKCFANDTFGTKNEEYVNENKHCYH